MPAKDCKKLWVKPKKLRAIKPSRYEQSDPKMKSYWKNAIRNLEKTTKDEQFWSTEIDKVRECVDPTLFNRLQVIFDLPIEHPKYIPQSEPSSVMPSVEYCRKSLNLVPPMEGDLSNLFIEPTQPSDPSVQTSEIARTQSRWSTGTVSSKASSLYRLGSQLDKSRSRLMSNTQTNKSIGSIISKPWAHSSPSVKSESTIISELAHSEDDVEVHLGDKRNSVYSRNPHYHLLYCNKSETDMITWQSKYKKKTDDVSATAEFAKKAEITSKKIAQEFFDWWSSLDIVEFKSGLTNPKDVEDLFQVWFDEQASRNVTIDPKIIPCVKEDIANYAELKASCHNILERQIVYDTYAETNAAHGIKITSQTRKMKVPHMNQAVMAWCNPNIPQDLKTMECVWQNIEHMTITKAFHKWLTQHRYYIMPPFLEQINSHKKMQPFTVPSDVLPDVGELSDLVLEMSLSVSNTELEIADFLKKITE